MEIEYELLPEHKRLKYNANEKVDLYPYATELYQELNRIGIIERLKEIPQLGVIKVKKRLGKTRYDYVMLQLYLHQIIKKNLQSELRLTYNNSISESEFIGNYHYQKGCKTPSIGDVIQLLTIAYNIGHFYNTFTSSRAVLMMLSEDELFKDFICHSEDERFKSALEVFSEDKNYHRLHLLNSILVLDHCDQSKPVILLSKEILYDYINESQLPTDSKLEYAFNIFRKVRTVSYMAYDLQNAETPLTIDLADEHAMCLLLKELLSEYNNNQPSDSLIKSVVKMLDDTLYNESSNAICYYQISRKMVSLLSTDCTLCAKEYYNDLLIDKDSIFNRQYIHRRDFNQSQILKLTFKREEKTIAEDLLDVLEHTNNTRVGFYNRQSGERTVLVSLKKNCDSAKKRKAAFKVLQSSISSLRRITGIKPCDSRFLLSVKFFLFYLFDENPLLIKPTIDREKCILCTRGKNSRIKEVRSLIDYSVGNDDEEHEAIFLISQLQNDHVNDTTITIQASIVVYQKNAVGRKLCEFDGMIIHPMRKQEQIIFLEAKNTRKKPEFGKKCLAKKLGQTNISFSVNDINVIGHDASFRYSI